MSLSNITIAGALNIRIDSDDDETSSFSAGSTIQAGSLTLSSGGTNDTLTLSSGIVAAGGITANNWSDVRLNGNQTAPLSVSSLPLTIRTLTNAGQYTVNGLTLGSALNVNLRGTTPGNTTSSYDQIVVNGGVNLNNATLNLSLNTNTATPPTTYTPTSNGVFTIIDNDGTDAISGTFAGLAEGSTFIVGSTNFRISYLGGTGNDVVVSVVVPDTIAPTASLTAIPPITTGGGTTLDFTVVYSDNVAISVSNLDNLDIRVTGPANLDQAATLVSVDTNTDGTPRTATYRIAAPGGSWNNADNGTYTVVMQANQVRDTASNAVAGGNLGSFTVNALPIPPIITLPTSPSISYTENAVPQLIATGASVTDADSLNFNNGNLTVRFTGDSGTDDDRLAIRNQGTSADQIGISNSNVTYSGTVIGAFTGGIGTTDLVITLNAAATPAIVQALVQNLTFANVSDIPNGTARTIELVLNDGNGSTSNPVTQTIDVTNINDAPTGNLTITGNIREFQTITAPVITDADGLGTISYQWQSSTDGTNWNSIATANNTPTYYLRSAQVGQQIRVLLTYTDGAGNAELVESNPTIPITPAPLSPWVMAGQADFNGDGNTDLLWHNPTNGWNQLWSFNGNNRQTFNLPTMANPDFRLVAVGDLDGDGKADLLWRNPTTGWNQLWRMDGSTRRDILNLPAQYNLNFQVTGVADFNGDGTADILWRNPAQGWNRLWLMNPLTGTRQADIALPSFYNPNYQIASLADFNGDGKADILWHNNTQGWSTLWTLNANYQATATVLATMFNRDFQLVGASDFNGDGKADLIWRNNTVGWLQLWTLDGASDPITTTNLPTLYDLDFQITGLKDMDGDGKADLLWRQPRSGANRLSRSTNQWNLIDLQTLQ